VKEREREREREKKKRERDIPYTSFWHKTGDHPT
jgi:hypothetical protein